MGDVTEARGGAKYTPPSRTSRCTPTKLSRTSAAWNSSNEIQPSLSVLKCRNTAISFAACVGSSANPESGGGLSGKQIWQRKVKRVNQRPGNEQHGHHAKFTLFATHRPRTRLDLGLQPPLQVVDLRLKTKVHTILPVWNFGRGYLRDAERVARRQIGPAQHRACT